LPPSGTSLSNWRMAQGFLVSSGMNSNAILIVGSFVGVSPVFTARPPGARQK
jgi:hypothetical protein